MFIPGQLVQLLQRLRSGVLGEEVRVESVLGLVVRLHLAERYQVTGRWKFTLFSLSVQWSTAQAMKFFKYFKSTQNILYIAVDR